MPLSPKIKLKNVNKTSLSLPASPIYDCVEDFSVLGPIYIIDGVSEIIDGVSEKSALYGHLNGNYCRIP